MASDLIETMSPQKVYNRVLLGFIIAIVGLLFWHSLFPKADPNLKWAAFAIGVVVFLTGWRAVSNPMMAIRYARNPGKTVSGLVESWSPRGFKDESDLERSLHAFLKKQVPWVKITRQYGAGRVKCDIAVGKDVMIELKAGFKSTSKLQRLIGQLELYRKQWEQPILVVLAGETEDDLLRDLTSHANKLGGITVITKKALKVSADAKEDA